MKPLLTTQYTVVKEKSTEDLVSWGVSEWNDPNKTVAVLKSSSSRVTESLSAIFYPASCYWHPETFLPLFLSYQYLLFEEDLASSLLHLSLNLSTLWNCWINEFWENTIGSGTMFVFSVTTSVKSNWVGDVMINLCVRLATVPKYLIEHFFF